ncbi:MAG: glycosyltransferase family 2 protein, partial [Gaiellales bacterium]
MIRRWRDLVPGVGKPSVQLWGHRFVRSSIGPLAHALLLARAARSARRSTAAAVFVALHLAGIVGLLARARG